MSSPRVFVVNEPLRRNPDTGDWERTMNLRRAKDFGDLIFLLPAGQLPEDSSTIVASIQDTLSSLTPEDHLLLVGDMRAIAAACAVSAQRVGHVRCLIWLREQRRYESVTLALEQCAPDALLKYTDEDDHYVEGRFRSALDRGNP